MKVGAALMRILVTNSDVTGMVSARLYPERAPEGAAAPFIVYSIVSNQPSDSKNGTPIDEAQVEVFSVASTYADTNKLADFVRAAVDRQSTEVLVDSELVKVESIQYTNEVTEVDTDKNLYVAVQDYTIRIIR
tara:strand:+ start:135 stop:533 length:399 start_codon:yes stop_codon:yes gene_type:complete